MELIGFRHTEEDIERIKTSCERNMRITNKKNLPVYLTNFILFITAAIIVYKIYSAYIFPLITEAITKDSKIGHVFLKYCNILLDITIGMAGFAATTIIITVIFWELFRWIRELLHIHTEYDNWNEYALECRDILGYYDNEYQMLLECKGYGARLNEHNNIVFDSVDKDSGLPCVKQICLSQELRDHIFANGTITFEYYDGRLDEIEGKIQQLGY